MEFREAMDGRRDRARAASVDGLGFVDLRPGDLIEVAYQGGERDARVTRVNQAGDLMYQSRQKGGRRPGEWDREQPLERFKFLRVTCRP